MKENILKDNKIIIDYINNYKVKFNNKLKSKMLIFKISFLNNYEYYNYIDIITKYPEFIIYFYNFFGVKYYKEMYISHIENEAFFYCDFNIAFLSEFVFPKKSFLLENKIKESFKVFTNDKFKYDQIDFYSEIVDFESNIRIKENTSCFIFSENYNKDLKIDESENYKKKNIEKYNVLISYQNMIQFKKKYEYKLNNIFNIKDISNTYLHFFGDSYKFIFNFNDNILEYINRINSNIWKNKLEFLNLYFYLILKNYSELKIKENYKNTINNDDFNIYIIDIKFIKQFILIEFKFFSKYKCNLFDDNINVKLADVINYLTYFNPKIFGYLYILNPNIKYFNNFYDNDKISNDNLHLYFISEIKNLKEIKNQLILNRVNINKNEIGEFYSIKNSLNGSNNQLIFTFENENDVKYYDYIDHLFINKKYLEYSSWILIDFEITFDYLDDYYSYNIYIYIMLLYKLCGEKFYKNLLLNDIIRIKNKLILKCNLITDNNFKFELLENIILVNTLKNRNKLTKIFDDLNIKYNNIKSFSSEIINKIENTNKKKLIKYNKFMIIQKIILINQNDFNFNNKFILKAKYKKNNLNLKSKILLKYELFNLITVYFKNNNSNISNINIYNYFIEKDILNIEFSILENEYNETEKHNFNTLENSIVNLNDISVEKCNYFNLRKNIFTNSEENIYNKNNKNKVIFISILLFVILICVFFYFSNKK